MRDYKAHIPREACANDRNRHVILGIAPVSSTAVQTNTVPGAAHSSFLRMKDAECGPAVQTGWGAGRQFTKGG
jgi:hypothetical protein